jgi:hypothetical protein
MAADIFQAYGWHTNQYSERSILYQSQLTLNACHGNGTNDITLEDGIEKQHWYSEDQGTCHELAIVKGVLTLKSLQTDR